MWSTPVRERLGDMLRFDVRRFRECGDRPRNARNARTSPSGERDAVDSAPEQLVSLGGTLRARAPTRHADAGSDNRR
jgi:hypothetical protein